MKNSDRFITAFNRIEHQMKTIVGSSDYMTFFKLIDRARKLNAVVDKFEEDLREFADLRNAIVHHRTAIEFVIAEPHLTVVEEIERIDQMLSKPVTVGDLFRRKVTVLQADDTLNKALESMHKFHFTQFPIYRNEEYVGLLTTAGIAFWMAENHHRNIISQEIKIGEVLDHEKSRDVSKFISVDMSIFKAEELFKKSVVKGKRLEALLIRENGQLIGIITPIDMMKIEGK